MMGGDVFRSSIAAVVVIGFFAAAFAYALAPHLMIGWKWLLNVVLVFALLITPRVTVLVNDQLTAAPPRVVDNVPLGLAALGSLTSSIASRLTEATETAFQFIPAVSGAQLPPELSYTRHGMAFANRLMMQSRNATFTDANFRIDVINYVRNCTFPDLANGYIKMDVWQKATNLWSIMGDSNPARFSTIRTASGAIDVQSCPDVYQSLNQRMPANVQDTKSAISYAMNVGLDPQNAVTRIDAQLERAYNTLRLAQAAQGAADLIRQNAMINAIRDAHLLQSQSLNDPAAMMLALSRAQGIASANLAYRNSAAVQVQSMPVLRSGLEFVLYALFPFIVLLLLISHGKAAAMICKSYAMTAVWIQLWPPMFAVVSYLVTLYTGQELEAAAQMGNGAGIGLSLYTADVVYSTTLSATSVISYMFVAVPLMAAAVVWGAERLVSFAAAAAGNAQRPVDNASSSAASGNLSLGNLTSDQLRMAPMQTSPYVREDFNIYGRQLSSFGASDGRLERFSNTSQLPTNLQFSQAQATKFAKSAKESEGLAIRQSERATESCAADSNEASGVQKHDTQSRNRSASLSVDSGASDKSSLNSMPQIAEDVTRIGEVNYTNDRNGFNITDDTQRVISEKARAEFLRHPDRVKLPHSNEELWAQNNELPIEQAPGFSQYKDGPEGYPDGIKFMPREKVIEKMSYLGQFLAWSGLTDVPENVPEASYYIPKSEKFDKVRELVNPQTWQLNDGVTDDQFKRALGCMKVGLMENGIQNSYQQALGGMREIGIGSNEIVMGVYNPQKRTVLGDGLETIFTTWHADTTPVGAARIALDKMIYYNNGGVSNVYAHSEGSAIMNESVSMLSDKQRSKINLFNFGTAASFAPSGLRNYMSFENNFDPVVQGYGRLFGSGGVVTSPSYLFSGDNYKIVRFASDVKDDMMNHSLPYYLRQPEVRAGLNWQPMTLADQERLSRGHWVGK